MKKGTRIIGVRDGETKWDEQKKRRGRTLRISVPIMGKMLGVRSKTKETE